MEGVYIGWLKQLMPWLKKSKRNCNNMKLLLDLALQSTAPLSFQMTNPRQDFKLQKQLQALSLAMAGSH